MTYFQSQSLNQLNVKTCMHTHSFDLYLHLSQLILIHNTHILKNQWELKRSNTIFFKRTTKKTKILPIPPHLKYNIVLNVEIKVKEHKRMTENKLKREKIKDKEKESKSDFFPFCAGLPPSKRFCFMSLA